jgi:hypothetical protein
VRNLNRHERWIETAWDDESGVNPPFNKPAPLPPHQHDALMSGWCPICRENAELDRKNHPENYAKRDCGKER